jgi:hypothetical protein
LPLGYPILCFSFCFGDGLFIGCQQSSSFQFCDIEILAIFPKKLAKNKNKIPNISPLFCQIFFFCGGEKINGLVALPFLSGLLT